MPLHAELYLFVRGGSRAEGKYHRLSHLVPICLEVQLVQALLDAVSGGPGALREQHTEVMDKILSGRHDGQVLMRSVRVILQCPECVSTFHGLWFHEQKDKESRAATSNGKQTSSYT